ncbi:MAG: type II secretion system F family protein [Planctomycetes bacterium]|nr:type II secretion system F family protein [Planctomycetota bacterium]
MSLFGVTLQERLAFYEGLRVMTSAGLPISRCLNRLRAQGAGRPMGRVAADLEAEVQAGSRIAEAMRRHRDVFSEMEVNMILAGETGGTLEDSIRSLATFLDRQQKIRNQLITSALYPIAVFHAAALLPPIKLLFFDGLGAYLEAVGPILGALYGLAFGFWVLNRLIASSRALAAPWDRVKLSLPLFGTMARKASVARAMRSLASLYKSGVTIFESLDLAARSAGNALVRERLLRTLERIKDGRLFSEAIEESHLLDTTLVGMIVAGDESGQMDECLLKVAEYLEEDVTRGVERTMKILPIILFLGIAAYVGYLVIQQFASYANTLSGMAGGS